MNRTAKKVSRAVGILFVAAGIALALHAYNLVDVSHHEMTSQLGGPVPPQARVPGGVAAFVLFAIPAMLFGLRLIVKPVGWHETIG